MESHIINMARLFAEPSVLSTWYMQRVYNLEKVRQKIDSEKRIVDYYKKKIISAMEKNNVLDFVRLPYWKYRLEESRSILNDLEAEEQLCIRELNDAITAAIMAKRSLGDLILKNPN